jgi:hypothetical protein
LAKTAESLRAFLPLSSLSPPIINRQKHSKAGFPLQRKPVPLLANVRGFGHINICMSTIGFSLLLQKHAGPCGGSCQKKEVLSIPDNYSLCQQRFWDSERKTFLSGREDRYFRKAKPSCGEVISPRESERGAFLKGTEGLWLMKKRTSHTEGEAAV